ncbi:methylated-DNA--[protein]-cysteine S-methyltransferase [Myxococcota bacterium]|nr:methylated-DNA--[protein]-cysteine S-methyltransferase [Myxococcota bacterium]
MPPQPPSRPSPPPGFRRAVWERVTRIPRGRVLGYGMVAAMLGSPRAARQVGYALAALPPDTAVPWWRVLRSDGSIAMQGDPDRGPRQAELLTAEGVEVVDGRVDMARWCWDPGVDEGGGGA